MKWKRIILDEAHVIRNYKAQTSIAACALRTKTRWALTGTPVHNKELDLYALLKFLRCSPFDDLAVSDVFKFLIYLAFIIKYDLYFYFISVTQPTTFYSRNRNKIIPLFFSFLKIFLLLIFYKSEFINKDK